MSKVLVDSLALREKLYQILQGAVEGDSAKLDVQQNMGIALSQSVLKEKGVLNLQVQSVAIKNVMHQVTEVLRVLDQARPIEQIELEPKTIEVVAQPSQAEMVDKIIDANLEKGISLNEFLETMMVAYMQAAYYLAGQNATAAAERLKISYSRFLNARKKHKF